MAGETDRKVEKDEAFSNLKKRVDKIRQKVAEDHSEEEINKKFSDIFNGRINFIAFNMNEVICLSRGIWG